MSDSETVREVNRAYYERPAPGRSDYWRKMAAPRQRVSVVLSLLKKYRPESLVDLGCGNGQLLQEISCRSSIAELAGIDLSSSQIEANRVRLPEVEWHALDVETPSSLPDGLRQRFEAVVALEIVEHLERPELLLRTAAELAHPTAGRLILSTQSGPVRETERRVGHLRHFSREEIRELLSSSGWTPVRVWNCGYPFHDLSKAVANQNPDRTLERFGERRYGILENAVALGLRFAYAFNSRRRGAQLFAVATRTVSPQLF